MLSSRVALTSVGHDAAPEAPLSAPRATAPPPPPPSTPHSHPPPPTPPPHPPAAVGGGARRVQPRAAAAGVAPLGAPPRARLPPRLLHDQHRKRGGADAGKQARADPRGGTCSQGPKGVPWVVHFGARAGGRVPVSHAVRVACVWVRVSSGGAWGAADILQRQPPRRHAPAGTGADLAHPSLLRARATPQGGSADWQVPTEGASRGLGGRLLIRRGRQAGGRPD